jgi:hypothetical protein
MKMIFINSSKCFECGNDAEENHHIIPRVLGGVKTIPLCSSCHGKAHGFNNREGHRNLTKIGLAKAKERGVKLGSPQNLKPEHRIKGAKVQKLKSLSDVNNLNSISIIIPLREKGLTLKEIANELNSRNFKTSKGNIFRATTVKRLYDRYKNANESNLFRH